ncbi:MAG: hypothetical protein JST52_03250 [Bacteroidetes bacterium]|nr:hypothetical protein [Bacteroidota bacterium]MBS1740553.1 hypothetical protein [Bacteroidota bacterium]
MIIPSALRNIFGRGLIVCLPLIFLCQLVFAQKKQDSSAKLPIEILPGNGTRLEYITTDSGAINKLINNVSLKQGDTYMYCDSAYINLVKNNVQAFGNVRIIQPGGTQVNSNYLRYTGNTKKAFLQGNVSLTDGKNNLWAESLLYDLTTKVATYDQGGTLQSETTTLSSNTGMYNAKSKDARFTVDVFVTDPQYSVTSKDLGYNTESKMVRFFDSSLIINDKSELQTNNGTWDAKNELANLITRSSILSEARYLEGDKIDYNKKTGIGIVTGNVYALDTAQKITLFSGWARYDEKAKKLWTAIKPVLKRSNGNDSLYMRADTFFAAPVPLKDSLFGNKNSLLKGKGKNVLPDLMRRAVLDSVAAADSSRPRYFIGYHHVLVYSDSMQARCDSISYSQSDSIMRLMYQPVVWSRKSQITGDTILLYSDTSSIRKLFVPNNSFIISQAGPDQSNIFDQVQGKSITGYFEHNAIREMIVWPNAEAIQYAKDDIGAYLGMNQAQCDRIRVFFDSSEVKKIVLEQDVKQTMTPMRQVDFLNARLSRFIWLPDQRPKSIAELFLFNPNLENKEDSSLKEKKLDSDLLKPNASKQHKK